jgi:phosphohistidine phosphatase
MAKTLYLMRHAKSDWNHPELSDFERPLNKRGLRDAPEMGRRLKEKDLIPELILCSPAERTRQTLDLLDLGVEHIIFNESIYEAYTETLLYIVQSIDDRYDSALILGHNPAMSWLASGLSGVRIGNMPTCAIAEISLQTDQWNKADSCPAELKSLDYPKQSN